MDVKKFNLFIIPLSCKNDNGRLFAMTLTKEKRNLLIGGGVVGLVAGLLVLFGNPKNMGFCIACFVRDVAGGLKLQTALPVRYIRPEVLGLILGSFIIAIFKGEFRPRGGSSPALRFIISAFVMIGALAFLGCPLRMVIRLAGGDLNAALALVGFIAGIALGAYFLTKGFSLGRYKAQDKLEGGALPFFTLVLLILFIAVPSIFAFSETGPGSQHAPIVISLLAGLAVGAIAQRTRLCMVGGIRDAILVKDSTLLCGYLSLFGVLLIWNLATGNFHLGFSSQPIAHSDHAFNFLGMFLVGLGSVMLGGCPLRQLILAGEGNSDSAVSVMGLLFGAAISHNFSLAGAAYSEATKGGVSTGGRIAVIFGILFLVAVALLKIRKVKKEEENA